MLFAIRVGFPQPPLSTVRPNIAFRSREINNTETRKKRQRTTTARTLVAARWVVDWRSSRAQVRLRSTMRDLTTTVDATTTTTTSSPTPRPLHRTATKLDRHRHHIATCRGSPSTNATRVDIMTRNVRALNRLLQRIAQLADVTKEATQVQARLPATATIVQLVETAAVGDIAEEEGVMVADTPSHPPTNLDRAVATGVR